MMIPFHYRQVFALLYRRDRLLLLLSFAAYSMRLFHLDAQSLWYDEGYSAWLSVQPLSEITARTAADIHPPLYYYLLHFWIGAAGSSEFSLRFLSLVPGVLLVPVTFLLARRILGEATGWIAALLTLSSPMYIWYAQEARMYMLLALFTALSAYFLWRWTEDATLETWVAMTACNIIAVYLHFFGFFIVAFQFVYFFMWWVRQETRWGVLIAGITSPLMVLFAYLPWARYVLQRLSTDQSFFEGTLPVSEVIRKTLILFTAGQSMLEIDALLPAVGFAALAMLGFLVIGRLRRDRLKARDDNPFRVPIAASSLARLFLLLYLTVPFILLYAVSYDRPKFHPRYLMIAAPPFVILVSASLAFLFLAFWHSQGSSARRRLFSIALLGAASALVVSVCTSAVYNLYFDSQFSKDDFRGVVAAIKANRKADETSILVSGHMFPVYQYYDPTGHWVPLPDDLSLSTQHILGYNVAQDLNRALKNSSGAWVVLWQNDIVDPGNFTMSILDTQARRLPQPQSFWGVQLLHYQIAPGTVFSDKPQIQHPAAINFGNQIEVLGYSLPSSASPADRGMTLTLYWRAQEDLKDDYQVALRARDSEGHEVGRLDVRPVTYNYPTTRWKKGDVLFGNLVVPLAPGTPPGVYQVGLTLYSQDNPSGLNIVDEAGNPAGPTTTLRDIPIERAAVQPALDKLNPSHPVHFTFTNTVQMLGFDLDRDRAEPGESINITVYWRALGVPREDLRLRFETLRGGAADDNFVGDNIAPLASGYPTSMWKTGDIVRSQYTFYIPPEISAGERAFRLSVLDQNNRRVSAPVALGDLHIEPSTRVFNPPAVSRLDGVRFGGLFQLYGFDVTPAPAVRNALADVSTISAGDTVKLKLYWRALQRSRTAYNVFVHLLSEKHSIIAQRDNAPVNGIRPTTTWIPAEFVADDYQLLVPRETPIGTYSLEIGFVDPNTGQRLAPQAVTGATSSATASTLGVRIMVR